MDKPTTIDVPPPNYHAVTVSDLIQQCNDSVSKMSRKNPNRVLLYNCATALRQLVNRLATYEDAATMAAAGRIN